MKPVHTRIRAERPEDHAAVRKINEKAFGQSQEAGIVDRLRRSCGNLLSLVALINERPVGHILFSPALIEPEVAAGGRSKVVRGMGLAPMAVLPELQRQGIGSSLVWEGLRILRAAATAFVIVLGHPEYYPRFGFEPVSRYGIRCQWPDVPKEAFMILVINEKAGRGVTGTARYREEFDLAM